MDHSNTAPQTYTFKLNCPKCQKKAQKMLSTTNGVYTIRVEGDAGRVTINKVPEHPSAAFKNSTPIEQNDHHMQVAAGNGQSLLKGYEVADMKELAKAKKLKQLEFTQTRRVRMTFNEEKDDRPHQNGSHKGTQQEPKKGDEPNHVGHGDCLNGSKADTGPNDSGDCLNGSKAETSPNDSGAPLNGSEADSGPNESDACPGGSKAATGPVDSCVCPHGEGTSSGNAEGTNPRHCAEFAFTYDGPYYTPPHYHQRWPHGYGYYYQPLPRLLPPLPRQLPPSPPWIPPSSLPPPSLPLPPPPSPPPPPPPPKFNGCIIT